MHAINLLPAKLLMLARRLADDRLVRNLGWYGLAELAARISRLIATVVLARALGAAELGVAAIAITCFELVRVLTNNGLGQLVVRASAEQLDATCNTAHRANWIACGAALVIQVVIGGAIAIACNRGDLFFMVAILAGVYLMMVPGLVPVYLLMREGRIKSIAGISVVQVITDNFLTAVFAIAGFGAWSIVLPKLITAPIWLYGVRRAQTWVPNAAAGHIDTSEVVRFTAPILGSEILGAARVNLDKLVVWGLLGVDALGIYYFAFNAGIGFSLALTSALSNSLYPELARLAADPKAMLARFDLAIMKTALPIAAVIGLQAGLCFIYVPIVFGVRWEGAVGLVALLCISASTKPFFNSGAQLLRAAALPSVELTSAVLLTTATLGMLSFGLTYGLAQGVAVFAIATMLLQVLFAIWARHVVSRRHSHDHAATASDPLLSARGV